MCSCAGTLCAACELVKQSKAQVAAVAVIIELTNLPGRKRVQDHLAADSPNTPLLALVSMDEGHV